MLLELASLSLYCCCWNICSCNSPGMLVLNSKPSMVLSICPLTDYIYGSQMKTGFCGGAAVNFSNLQESLSFYRASKFTLYATELHNSVYFLFIAPQSCVTSISK